jgi:NADH oxidase (H2O2-forming)
MNKYDIVVIGGGPAGVTSVISARNTYKDKKIALIRKESQALIPCGIPYTLCSLSSVDDDILPDKLVTNTGSDLIIDEVVDKKDKTLFLKNGTQLTFDKLVLAMGSNPILPNIEGVEKEGIFLVKKDKDYLNQMRDYAIDSQNIVIIGGGYIGIEMADEAIKAGKKVTVIEQLDHLLGTSMDSEFSEKSKQVLENNGAQIILGQKVNSILGNGVVSAVQLQNNKEIPADMVIISCGSKPNTQLAEKFGLDFDPKNGIFVNEYLRTSDKDIFAIGDCAIKRDFFSGEPTDIRLASTAMAEGRLAGSDLFQIKVIREYPGVLGSFSTKIGDTAFGVSGITETRAKAMNLDYVVGEADTIDRHPGKLQGASSMHLKLIYSRYSHRLLGAQMWGGDSVGELVNMFAVMILKKMTDMEIDTLQIGTHPLLTASPVVYPVITATVDAIKKWY